MDLQGIAAIIGSIGIPLVLFYASRQIAKQREKSEARNQQLLQVGQLIDSLSSTNPKKRMIALQLVRQLQTETSLPASFLTEVGWLAVVDDPSAAGAAQVVLGSHVPDIVLLLDFLGPIIDHLDRSEQSFKRWHGFNEALEDEVMRSNKFIRDHLISRWHLIPPSLSQHAQELIEHYDAWLAKYERLRPDGIRDKTEPFVFVGPDGFPFPIKSEHAFREWRDKLKASVNAGLANKLLQSVRRSNATEL
jgi:hypothetical protein